MDYQEPDWISSEPRSHGIYEALLSFLHEASADRTRLQHLSKSTVAKLHSTLTPELTAEQYKLECEIFYGILLSIVKDLDHAVLEQDHLIELVVTIRNTPLPASVVQTTDPYDPYDPYDPRNEMNRELTPLMSVFSDFERDAPLHPPLEERPETPANAADFAPWRQTAGTYLAPDLWKNLNAFLARLHTAVPGIPYVDVRGLFAMIEALEQPLTPTPLEDVLPAAAVWILYAAPTLKGNDTPYPGYPNLGCKRLPGAKESCGRVGMPSMPRDGISGCGGLGRLRK